ncbi:hypothetical protein I6A60_15450 [Frankia sp. AgB1.9]|uniref:hypothetical protein n=1 Tax=unclassified Frankia TaxID=2632575 RepID=UPI0019321924|nr:MULTISPECIES: hypothetical protein [unclassified Frankia]MBL7492798.1 hypothetical protein [Frankia sp. AgW1.1]MBL7549271.1 hypothetical protein [Frankia sp. AgB1.9]MBL7619261.1 hypothetical protein [Frankia sp. AgB1.8]
MLPGAITARDTTNVTANDTTLDTVIAPTRRWHDRVRLSITTALSEDLTAVIASNSVTTRDIAMEGRRVSLPN